jgi:hypothetical protein
LTAWLAVAVSDRFGRFIAWTRSRTDASRVGGLAEVIDALFIGLFLGLGFGFLAALGGNFVEDLDVHALEALQRRFEVARRGYILWQKVIYLVEGEITLPSSEVEETLQIFAPVIMLHPISGQAEYRLAQELRHAFAGAADVLHEPPRLIHATSTVTPRIRLLIPTRSRAISYREPPLIPAGRSSVTGLLLSAIP